MATPEEIEHKLKETELQRSLKEVEKLDFELKASRAEKAAAKKWNNKLFKEIKSWSAIIITVVGGGTAIYKFYDPIAKKIEIEKSQYDTKISEDMLGFVNIFNEKKSVDVLNIAALSLSSYETDALPYILFNMESHPENYEICARSLKLIQGKKHSDPDVFYSTIMRFFDDYVQFNPSESDYKMPTIELYIRLMIKLDFLTSDKKAESLAYLKKLANNPVLSVNQQFVLKTKVESIEKIIQAL